jgi:hypothetical protein
MDDAGTRTVPVERGKGVWDKDIGSDDRSGLGRAEDLVTGERWRNLLNRLVRVLRFSSGSGRETCRAVTLPLVDA